MRTLYVADQGAQLRKAGHSLRIELAGKCIGRVSPQGLDHAFLFGGVSLTPQAIRLLMEERVPVGLLSSTGKLIGRITPAARGWVSRRKAQYAVADDPRYALRFAQSVVRAKLSGCLGLLRRYKRNHGEVPVDAAVQGLQQAKRALGDADDLAGVRAAEGRGSAAYFGCFREVLRQGFVFERRLRRPPPDPINALLSLGYGLLRAEIEGQLEAVGLDPRVGFLHVERAGRPALALDLIEEFRAAVVDRLVLRCVNLRVIRPEDFAVDEELGCRLTPDGLKTYLKQYDHQLSKVFLDLQGKRTCYRRVLHRQAREAAEAFSERRPYRPFSARL